MEGAKRNAGALEPGPGAVDIPSTLAGTKFSFGNRFDGIPFDHPAFQRRRKLLEKEEKHPQLIALPSLIGKGPGVKYFILI